MKYRSFVKRYLLLLPTGTALLVLVSLCLIRYDNPSISDIRRRGLGYNTITYHRFSRLNCNNEIVMVGDSTLLMGIIPKVLEEKLNTTVISLGLYATSGLSAYTLMLDNYLRQNKKPKYIIFYFSTSTPYYFNEHSYERSYTLLKYGSLTTLFHTDEINVTDIVHAAWIIFTGMYKNMFHITESIKHFRNDILSMNTTKGYVNNSVSISIDPDCKLNTSQQKNLDLAFIDKLKKRYESMGIRVLYCVSPMPECDTAATFFMKKYSNADNRIITFPNHFFTDSRHMTESGALLNSKLFANYLQTKLCRSDASK